MKPALVKSWIEVPADCHFPIQNLPLGTFFNPREGKMGPCVRIGDHVLDLQILFEKGLISLDSNLLFDQWEFIFEGGRAAIRSVREQASDLLREDNSTLRDDASLRDAALHRVDDVEMLVPVPIGAFVDFYSSEHHATNVGKMFRPQGEPLLPNWKHLPVGYNGRASSVIVSGEEVIRPCGQTKSPQAEKPSFGPTKELDFELEVGFFLADSTDLGEARPIGKAMDMIAGVVLVNDWSARDIQRWEYQPLGPFLAKSFATSISPWIVTLDALDPWRTTSPAQTPEPLPYLRDSQRSHYDIQLEVAIQTAAMTSPQTICRTNYKEMYWSMAQQLAHQMVNGTNVQIGDLYASGTISGSNPASFGSMLELAWKGERPILLKETGETRAFVEDRDTVIMTGWCQGEGYRVGFGEVRAAILPSVGGAG